ncbi:tRNA (guanosine(18)-2'-O)-methyltransferase [Oryza brachyantha]|nr:tRNA (guanosine(18)-2'-O)-methyltransferase [Oryza brachyantha]XP_015694919.2 tRNA (guanosine(18)-2'-O)-methyltransferase [Oryza brachyantha]XP_015694920.2 tRNA (guanosine(18)-2'-O)-methyltransferase [Oryza brachyantha]XP_015694921.2 tRNA (guanosine(18)-2'-O)-methyltransferase [Oryza brachyantha]XP_040381634.1 tRNA (guanosine(18)-2'-O)-methyltransferase [Oryza brachyantha]
MASRTLSVSSLASAFASTPRPRLHVAPGSRIRASPLSTAAAAAATDGDADGVDTVEQLLVAKPSYAGRGRIDRLMKLQRRADGDLPAGGRRRWFPYLDAFRAAEGVVELGSREVVEVLEPHILEARRERIRRAVESRSYSVCLVVEGLSDFGNVSAAFRSADALGVQSVHVISCDNNKRYRDNRHVSMGAEKWLDIELWNSTAECFDALKRRGYRIATTYLGNDSVSVYDMDWSHPTAIVVGNELMGISDAALKLSDLHCSVPMKGMVDSFNVSVAAGILMHHAVCDRVSRLGHHGDLLPDESRILLAEFYLRHRESTAGIVHEYAKRKAGNFMAKF